MPTEKDLRARRTIRTFMRMCFKKIRRGRWLNDEELRMLAASERWLHQFRKRTAEDDQGRNQ